MECAGVADSDEARGRPVAVDDGKDCRRRMVTCELEAAEALAGMARAADNNDTAAAATSAVLPSQDQTIAGPKWFCGHTTMVTSHERTEQAIENISPQMCSTSYQLNSISKSKPKFTEAEKEARKLRRVLANRESARQTIRRRQAMHLELTRKAAAMLEENGKLKKEKEQLLKEYNSLKERNEFLKEQMVQIKKAEPGETQGEPKRHQGTTSSSATSSTPVSLHNQPPFVPCFWPSVVPYSDFIGFQNTYHHNLMNNSSQVPRPDIPFFVYPVPWLLPFLAQSSTSRPHSDTHNTHNTHQCCTCTSTNILMHENNNTVSSTRNKGPEASNSTKPMSSGPVLSPGPFNCTRPHRNCQVDDALDLNFVSGPDNREHGLLPKSREPVICSPQKSEDIAAAAEARRRRKELMKLKNSPLSS